jgi:DNA excision repair protein ERCC-2
MSGTLSPMEMHKDLLGMDRNRTMLKSYPSPFPKQNRKNIIVRGITTKYTERTSENYERIATTVRSCINSIKGNVAIFFPSYEIRNYIHKLAMPSISKHIILEESGMTKEERDRIKDEMEKHATRGAVLFGVMGGSFSEGIDLPGELLNGVIIVGLPLNKPDLSVEALIDYYEERFHKGMAYGYLYPAMIKVIQSAGRCIRSEKDRGVIVFADERFTWRNYSQMFPRSWEFVITSDPEMEIRRFFG